MREERENKDKERLRSKEERRKKKEKESVGLRSLKREEWRKREKE